MNTQPGYATNAPKGYMGDPRRGAAMGRPSIGAHVEAAALRTRINNREQGLAAAVMANDRRQIEHEREGLERLRGQLAALDLSAPLTFTLQRTRLNAGGYDSCGAYWGGGQPLYWGGGQPLYWAADASGEIEMTFRADSRDAAKANVRAEYPAARFSR